jgi:hypothetical protein
MKYLSVGLALAMVSCSIGCKKGLDPQFKADLEQALAKTGQIYSSIGSEVSVAEIKLQASEAAGKLDVLLIKWPPSELDGVKINLQLSVAAMGLAARCMSAEFHEEQREEWALKGVSNRHHPALFNDLVSFAKATGGQIESQSLTSNHFSPQRFGDQIFWMQNDDNKTANMNISGTRNQLPKIISVGKLCYQRALEEYKSGL